MEVCRVVEIARFGPPSVLRLAERPLPQPGPGELRIAVRAAGVNFADVFGRMGLYAPAPAPPYVPGFEVAGVVDAVGDGVRGFAPGDRVIGGSRFGGYASHLVTRPERVLRLPAGWSFAEGAGFLATYGTAWHTLVTLGRIGPGSRVLIHAGAGGVGTAAIQIGRAHGARVVATAGGAAKTAFCQTVGAERGVDYSDPDWPRQAGEAVGGQGYDLILDSVLGPTFRPSLRLLAPMGHLVVVGAASFTPHRRRNWLVLGWKWLHLPRLNPLDLIPLNATLSGFNLLLLWEQEDYLRRLAAALEALAASGAVRPIVDRAFAFERAAEAHVYLEERRTRGKVVLEIGGPQASTASGR